MSMEQEIKKLKKNNKARNVFYYFMIYGTLISTLSVSISEKFPEGVLGILGYIFIIIWFSLHLSAIVLWIVLSINGMKRAKLIKERYTKESREKYGEITNRAWVEEYKKKQEEIKRKRIKFNIILSAICLLLFVPSLIYLILHGDVEAVEASTIVFIVVASLSSVSLFISLLMLIGCFVSLEVREYEIDGFLIIRFSYLGKEVLVLDGKEVSDAYSSWQEIIFSLPNGKEVEYQTGAVIFVEETNQETI